MNKKLKRINFLMKILKHAQESLVELKNIGQLHENYNKVNEIL